MENSSQKGRGRPREFNRHEALIAALKVFWEQGFEQASIVDLCAAMGIVPPSLYAAFGNKASLFLEAVRYYERMYWQQPAECLMAEPDVRAAIAAYFQTAAQILLSPAAPCGCMTVLSAINISPSETEIIAELAALREGKRKMFAERLRVAIQERQIPADTDVPAISGALTALLEGLSLQAREGLFLSELKAMAAYAQCFLPPRQAMGQAGAEPRCASPADVQICHKPQANAGADQSNAEKADADGSGAPKPKKQRGSKNKSLLSLL